jgi:NitT/TauT family transport system substrate-binding protein
MKIKSVLFALCIAVLAILVFVVGCKPNQSAPVPSGVQKSTTQAEKPKTLKPFQFLLDWQPEPTYLGVYYAREKGYYRELGLDVEIIPSWGANQAVASVAAGKSVISTASGGATVLGYNNGAKIVSLAVLYPKIPTVIYGLSGKDIHEPKDLIGKRIGIYPGSITANEFEAFLLANHIGKTQLQVISLSGADIPLLLADQIDAVLHYHEMSPVVVETDSAAPIVDGKRTFSIRLSQTGVPGYGLNIVTSRDALNKDGDLLRKVAAATVRGYEAARLEPENAAAVFHRLFPDKSVAYIKASLIRVNDMLDKDIGHQTAEGWQETINLYDSLGLLKTKPVPADILP